MRGKKNIGKNRNFPCNKIRKIEYFQVKKEKKNSPLSSNTMGREEIKIKVKYEFGKSKISGLQNK